LLLISQHKNAAEKKWRTVEPRAIHVHPLSVMITLQQ
jgi:hypothetical protein